MPNYVAIVRESNSWDCKYIPIGIYDNYELCWEKLEDYKNEHYVKRKILDDSKFRRKKQEFSDYTSEFFDYRPDYWEIEFISLHFEKFGTIENFYNVKRSERLAE